MPNLTATEMIPAVGQNVLLRVEKAFQITCRVLDVKTAYGNIRLLLTPDSGIGEQWVDLSRVTTLPVVTKKQAVQAESDYWLVQTGR